MSREHWDAQAETEEAAWHAVFSEPGRMRHTEVDARNYICELLYSDEGLPDGPLLEIGSGVGRLTGKVARRMSRKVVGIDISPRMVAWAMQREASPQLCSFMCGDAAFLEAVEQSWAGGFSMLTWQHIDRVEAQRYLNYLGRWMLPGARFVLQYVKGTYHGDHHHQYTVEEMREMITAAPMLSWLFAHSDWRHPEWEWAVITRD